MSEQQPYIRNLSFRICINKKNEKKTTTQLKRNKNGPSLVKTKRKKMVKKEENKSHYNFDNLNVVNLNEENTKRKN